MKAKFLALAALLVGMAACQTDPNGLELDRNGEAAVTLNVGLPNGATRAAGADSALGAIDNGIDLVNEYDIRFILEVYDANGELAKDRMVKVGDATEAAFNFRLVPGRDYKFVVWADFVANNSTAETVQDLHYETTNGLRLVAIKDWTAIDESRDAYTAAVDVENYSGASQIDPITLTRPFAKLRVVTNDIKEMITLRPDIVKVNYFDTEFYTAFDAFKEEPIDKTYTGHKLIVDLKEDYYTNENPDENGVEKGVKTLFADYFFAQEGDRVKFTMDVEFNDKSTLPQVIFNTDIPVKRNNLTTVYGPILTDANNVTVKIEEGFAGNINVGRYDTANKTLAEVLAEAASKDVEATIELAGNVEWTTGAGHGSTPLMGENAKTEVLTINGNGHTLTAKGSGVGAIRMANGGKVIFNNVKFVDESVSYNETAWELCYLEFGGALEFNNCEFVNAIQLEEANATFNNCSFNSHKDNEYAVWVCGNKAYFNECTFEGPRGLKVHEDYGSEVEEVVVDETTFNNIEKKPGIALGTLNAETAITIKNSTFNNCQAGDQGLYMYETDTDVTTFTFVNKNNTVNATVATSEAFAKVLKADIHTLNIALEGDVNVDVAANSTDYYFGGNNTNTITIDGAKVSTAATGADNNAYKLTFNHTNGDWNYIRLNNDNAKWVIKNVKLSNTGKNNGPWNRHDIRFYNDVVLQNVTSDKAIALLADADLTNVVISDVHPNNGEAYALWITAEGQTVNIKDCALLAHESKTTDRGIKIDNQYVDEGEAKVTLNIDGLKVKSQKKAAIVVKSKAGADINIKSIDITEVYADTYHAVWVDEDAADYANLVTVNGGNKMVEGDSAVAIVRDNNAMSTAIANGATKVILADGEYTMPATNGKDLTIIGGKDVIIKAGAANLGGGNVTLDGVTITAGSYQGFQHSGVVNYNNVTIKGQLNCYGAQDIFTNCTFELDNAYVWTYGSKKTVFSGCTFNTNGKAILVYNEGAGASNVTVENCTFNATAKAYAGAIKNQNCAAIEIDNFQSSGVGAAHTVATSNNTYSENFSGEWRIKNYVAGNAITVNGVAYTQIALDGKLMTINADKEVTVL